jgi:hypothetical protein
MLSFILSTKCILSISCLLTILYPIIIFIKHQYTPSFFLLHPIFMSISFICIVPLAVLTKQKPFPQTWSSPTIFHATLMFLSWVLALIGYGIIYKNKQDRLKPHLTSTHSWFGITLLIIHLSHPCIAIVLGLYPNFMPIYISSNISHLARKFHHVIGKSTLLLIFGTVFTGLLKMDLLLNLDELSIPSLFHSIAVICHFMVICILVMGWMKMI